jgi:hypothetical protein
MSWIRNEPSFEFEEGIETIETPMVRMSKETHLLGDKDRPSIVTVKRAVVRICSSLENDG